MLSGTREGELQRDGDLTTGPGGLCFQLGKLGGASREDVAFELSLEGFIYAEAGVRKNKQSAKGGKGKV